MDKTYHFSCSTVSPVTAKKIAQLYSNEGKTFVSSPVFARPDGIQKKQAIWMISGVIPYGFLCKNNLSFVFRECQRSGLGNFPFIEQWEGVFVSRIIERLNKSIN